MKFIEFLTNPLFLTTTILLPAFILYVVFGNKIENPKIKKWESVLAGWFIFLSIFLFILK